ncbi:MAG: ComEC/Rec2 family competence protein [Treponemataceae bacterium]|nr:ComEC/Rec2 family competence protein [Treponemataceae bacterium]
MEIIQKLWQFVKKISLVSLCAFFLAVFFYSSVFISSIIGAVLCGVLAILAVFNKISRKIIICALVAGILCIFVLFNLQNQQKNVISLIENEKITGIYGFCTNSPVKTENGSYLVTIQCFAVSGELQKFKIICGAKGFAAVILPQNIVENYYPGKIGTDFAAGTATGSTAVKSEGAVFGANDKDSGKKSGAFSANGDFLLVDTGLPVAFYGNFSKNGQQSIKYFYAQNAANVNSSIIKTYAKHPKWRQNKILGKICQMRGIGRIKLKKILYSFGKAGWFLLALFCGSKEYLDPFLKQNFLRAGVSHILALSGLHLSLVAGGAKKIAGIFAGAKLAAFIIFIFAWAFVLFASSAPSLNRALLFVFFNIFAKKLCVKPVLTKVLALSFILQLVCNVRQAQTGAFLLSYGAMLGIALILPLIAKKIEKLPKIPQKICSTLATCFAAQCGTFPLTLILYKSFVPFGIFASFLLIPLVSVFLILGVVCTLIAYFLPFCVPFLYQILNFFYNSIALIAQFFANLFSVNF